MVPNIKTSASINISLASIIETLLLNKVTIYNKGNNFIIIALAEVVNTYPIF